MSTFNIPLSCLIENTNQHRIASEKLQHILSCRKMNSPIAYN